MPTLVSVVSSQVLAVGASSGKFAAAMTQGGQYMYRCLTDSWVFVGATGGAAQADTANNHFVPAGEPLFLCNLEATGTTNSFVHAIRNTADGDATLSLLASRYV